MDKKKIGIIAVILLVIIAVVAAIFLLRDKEDTDDGKIPEFNYGQMAESMGKTEEELMEELEKPLPQEQQDKVREIFAEEKVPEIVEILDQNEDGTEFTFIDSEGNQGTMTVENSDLTDEELEDWNEQYLDMLDKIAAGEEVDDSWILEEPTIGNPTDPGDEGGQTDTIIIDTTSDPEEGPNTTVKNTEYSDEATTGNGFTSEDNPSPFDALDTYKANEDPNSPYYGLTDEEINELENKHAQDMGHTAGGG